MAPYRFKGLIANNIVKCKSFRGRPSSRQQELELDHDEVAALGSKLNGKPLCYNHIDGMPVGVVKANRVDGSGKWEIEGELHDDTPEKREVIEWVKGGLLPSLSLKHRPGVDEPIEVSLCFRGAREGTFITEKPVMLHDSKSGLYTIARDAPDVISCSSENADEELTFVTISASVMSTPEPVSAPVPPPAPTPGSSLAPVATNEQDVSKEFAATAQVSTLLQNSHSIPTRADRDHIAGIVATLEREKLELLESQKAMEAERAKFAEERKRMQQLLDKEAAENKRREDESAAQLNTQRQLAGDLLQNLSEENDPAAVEAALAGMNPKAVTLFAKAQQRFVAASTGEAPVEEEKETEVKRQMRLWFENKQKSTAPTPTHTEPPATMSQQQHQPWKPSVTPVAASRKPVAYGPGHPEWGKPIERRQLDGGGNIVQASYSNGFRQPTEDKEYDPGAGPNFAHHYMSDARQIDVYRGVPCAAGARTSQFSMVSASGSAMYSEAFLKQRRKFLQVNFDAKQKRGAQVYRAVPDGGSGMLEY